jgi:hypothetical protein
MALRGRFQKGIFVAWQGNSMGTAWYVWIRLKSTSAREVFRILQNACGYRAMRIDTIAAGTPSLLFLHVSFSRYSLPNVTVELSFSSDTLCSRAVLSALRFKRIFPTAPRPGVILVLR